jgi:hypothetical protein
MQATLRGHLKGAIAGTPAGSDLVPRLGHTPGTRDTADERLRVEDTGAAVANDHLHSAKRNSLAQETLRN